MRIGLVGTGRMGRPMLDQLIRAGHDCVVFARRPEARARLVAEGLACVDTLAAAMTDADVVIVVVLNDEQVQEVCLGHGGALAAMRSGTVLIQDTTYDPVTVERVAIEGAGRVGVLDAALSGGPGDILSGCLTLWIGGDNDLLAQVFPATGNLLQA